MTTSTQNPAAAEAVDSVAGNLLFGFSWVLVMAIGLMPIAEAMLNRTPSITMPTTIAFFIAVASGIILRRRYTWVGLVMHIYGQIVIWLSLFTMSLALVLFAYGKGLGGT